MCTWTEKIAGCSIFFFADVDIFKAKSKIFKTVDNVMRKTTRISLKIRITWTTGQDWQMRFNVGKCKVLHLGSRNPRYDYNMGDLILEAATEEKDLGVIVDDVN